MRGAISSTQPVTNMTNSMTISIVFFSSIPESNARHPPSKSNVMHNDSVENNMINRTLSCNFSMNGNANTPTVMNTTFVLPSANSTFTIDKGSKRKTGLPRDFANGSTNDFLDRLQMPPPPSQNPMSRSSQFSNSGVPLSLR